MEIETEVYKHCIFIPSTYLIFSVLFFFVDQCAYVEKITCRPLMHKTPGLLAKHFLYVKGLLSLDFLSFLRLRSAVHLQMY